MMWQACCTSSKTIDEINIPSEVRLKAEEFVITKTGKKFFNDYIRLDYKKTAKTENGYLMVYNLSIPDKEIAGEIRFSLDTLGNIKTNKEIVGIPECTLNPEDCSFNISKEEAASIAAKSGLDEGVKVWDIKFIWNTTYKKYLWDITSTLRERKGSGFYRAAGKTMLIDPGSGEIIKTNQWQIN